MAWEWVSVYKRCSQYKLTKTPTEANTFDHPAPRQMRKTFFAADGRLQFKACVTVSAVDGWTVANRAADREQILSLCLFYLCWLFLCENVCVCVCVCLYIGVRWVVSHKTCLSRRSKMSMDLTVARPTWKKQKPRGSPNWCMTCVAFRRRERLSWFVQRRRFVTVLILWWHLLSMNGNELPASHSAHSQFHCPCCDHMGASWHLSTLFGTSGTNSPLWWTAQRRSNSSSNIRATLTSTRIEICTSPTSSRDLCPWWRVLFPCSTNVFVSSTPVWRRKANVLPAVEMGWILMCSGKKRHDVCKYSPVTRIPWTVLVCILKHANHDDEKKNIWKMFLQLVDLTIVTSGLMFFRAVASCGKGRF